MKLPRELVANSGTKIVSYTYSATGEKLRMSDEQAPQVGGQLNALRDYVGPFQYLNGALFEIQTEEGRYTPPGGYEYFIRDHLGNVRSVVGNSGIVQYTDYDPSGWQLPGLTGGSGSNRLKYNGKEAVGELGTNVLDYGARFYDAQTGRWGVVDPLAEVSRRFSPYVYGNANPANMIDPDGMISQNASVYYQGQDARDYFAQILRQQGLSEQEGQGDPPSKRKPEEPIKGGGFPKGDLPSAYQQNAVVRAADYGPRYTDIEKASQLGVNMFWAVEGGFSLLKIGQWFKSLVGLGKGEEGVAATIEAVSELNPTHYLTKSKPQMQDLLNDIRENGVQESIKYVEQNGVKYIVDGHHRFFAAQKLGIQNVPVQQVTLPYSGYKSGADLIMEGKMPGYWKYLK